MNRYVLIVAGPLQTSVAVSIDEQGGSKSLAGEHNEGNAILQPSKLINNCIHAAWVTE
jgi:hypothetical protein